MARKIDENEGRLDEDARIYDKEFEDKKLSPKERFKAMTFREKVSYFNYYYLKGVIVSIVVLVLLFVAVKDYFTQDKVVVKIAVINSAYDDKEIAKMEKKIAKELHLSGKSVVKIDTSFSSETYDSKRALSALLNAGNVDIVIGDKEGFDFWAESGYFMCPDYYKQVKFYEKIDSKYRHYTNYTSGRDIRKGVKGKGKYNYGIIISDSEVFKSFKGVTDKEMVIGVNVETSQDEYSIMAEKYLLGNVYK